MEKSIEGIFICACGVLHYICSIFDAIKNKISGVIDIL